MAAQTDTRPSPTPASSATSPDPCPSPSPDRGWRAAAACREEAWPDPSIFFPGGMEWLPADPRIAVAKAICAGCPVRDACLADAVARGDEFAILGGTLPAERAALFPPARTVSLVPSDPTVRHRLDGAIRRRARKGWTLDAIAANLGVELPVVEEMTSNWGTRRVSA